MRAIELMLSFLLISSSLNAAKINSYNIDVKFDKSQKQLLINSLIDLQHEKTKNIKLLLSSNCTINSIKTSNEKNIQYSFKGKDTIVLTFDGSILAAPNIYIKFTYNYSIGDDTLILIDRGHRWYPMISENIAPFTMNVEVPKNYIAVSAGELLSEKNNGIKQYTFSSYVPVFKIPLIIAPENYYSVNQSDCENVKTYVYYIPNNNGCSIDSLQTDICNLLNYFSDKFGKYPFNRFNLVETSTFEGTNLGSSIITAGSVNLKGYSSGYNEWLNLAVATQWFGAGVFPKLFCKGFWFLSLSLPHYLRLMYIHDTEGEDAFNKQLIGLSEKYNEFAGTENDIPIFDIDFPNTKEKGILLYCKGVLVLDKIKKQIGEPNWISLLKYLHENYFGKTILMDDFINCIDKFEPSGKCSELLIKMLSEKGKFE